jgi:hypothetical protein
LAVSQQEGRASHGEGQQLAGQGEEEAEERRESTPGETSSAAEEEMTTNDEAAPRTCGAVLFSLALVADFIH